ncbi:MAG: competence/damage-inducible protein A [Actinomycetota bacterium]
MKSVEIFSIGDELLRGIVLDTNASWIAKRVAARGASVRRFTTLPDEPAVAGAELRGAIARAPSLIVTQGGLGPTHDDRTREALAIGTERAQERNAEAEAIVRRRFAELAAGGAVTDATLGPARMRMADLPAGGRALDNHVGTAPGIVLGLGTVTIVSLPGVPPELYWMWENTLAPTLAEVLGPGGFAEVTFETDLLDESSIAHVLRSTQQRHPDVYVKSRASGYEQGDEVRITLAAAGSNDDDARAKIAAATSDLRAALTAEGVTLQ